VTLREPPKNDTRAANVIGRMLGLLVLLAIFALVVWAAATNQQITAIERTDPVVNAPGDYTVADGIALHYRDTGGSGPVAVLVHDDVVAGGLTVWQVAMELAETGRRVVVPDLFGFGFSARPSEPGARLAVSGQADTLVSALEELELGPVELVGFGWGGEVAAEMAVSRPDVVGRLVLVDTTNIPGTPTGWHQLEGLPFGLGTAIAYNREGGAAPAERSVRGELSGVARLLRSRRAGGVPQRRHGSRHRPIDLGTPGQRPRRRGPGTAGRGRGVGDRGSRRDHPR
jgi:pimeloyl-ACP methyl ester carboxylesterase